MSEVKPQDFKYVRGVNIGGWLVIENFINPYFFSLTNCHLRGDFRFYEGQIDAPPMLSPLYRPMDEASKKACKPVKKYPVDEWTMTKIFRDANHGDTKYIKEYLDIHYDNFVTREDIANIKASGASHVRIPLGHWILGNIEGDEPYVEGGWDYFQRVLGWCREDGLEVWPDLHTAPGSQNGFDNSGHKGVRTCHGWDGGKKKNATTADGILPYNVRRTLVIIDQITSKIKADGNADVVTGFQLLNEVFNDCDFEIIKEFYNQGLQIVRKNLGENAAVYVPDTFDLAKFNGFWSTDDFKGTYLDSHFYGSFTSVGRELSPRQHIAMTCQGVSRTAAGCCYDSEGQFSKGMGRIFSEWSASYDRSIDFEIPHVMDIMRKTGVVPSLKRTIPANRRRFLRNFVEAQMVVFEQTSKNFYATGWFYWNFKMEGGAFAEWDYLRGIREGWIPKIPNSNISSEDLYGNCYSIMLRTDDDMSIVDQYPKPCNHFWCPPEDPALRGSPVTDDVVLSHGMDVFKNADGTYVVDYTTDWVQIYEWAKEAKLKKKSSQSGAGPELWQLYATVGLFVAGFLLTFLKRKITTVKAEVVQKNGYEKIEEVDASTLNMSLEDGNEME